MPGEEGPTLPLEPVDPVRYETLGEQGRGGIGVVHVARVRRLDRVVAIKELQRTGGTGRERFEREMRITARLQHPGIVPVHECGLWPDGSPFYTMKLVEGRSLKDAIAEKATLEERLGLLPHLVAVAEAIAYAHSRRVVHRDLKPSNVIVGAFGETVVIDWGLAKNLDDREEAEVAGSPFRVWRASDLTEVGAVVGTPAYMAPEQARGEPTDERADVYALGAMLFHLLKGQAPLTGLSNEVVAQLRDFPTESLAATLDGAPAELCTVVAKSMASSPSSRYATATEFASELKRFQIGQLVQAHHYSTAQRVARWARRHRAAVATAVLFFAVVAVGGSFAVARVVRERNLAMDARARADDDRQLAEVARGSAERRASQLVLAQAEAALATDPTKSIAWLKHYPANGEEWLRVWRILDDALSRGVSARVIPWRTTGGDLTFIAGTHLVAAVGTDRDVALWDTSRAERVRSLATSASTSSLSSSASGRWVAAVNNAGGVTLLDLRTGEQEDILPFAGGAHCLAFGESRDVLAVGGELGEVVIYDLPGLSRRDASSESKPILNLYFSIDDSRLAATTSESVVVYSTSTNATVYRRDVFSGYHPRFSRDGSRLVVGGSVRRAIIIDLARSKVRELETADFEILRIAVAPSGDRFATVGGSGALVEWDFDGSILRRARYPDDRLEIVRYSHDGEWLAAAGSAGIVRLYSRRAATEWQLLGHKTAIDAISFDRDAASLATTGLDEDLRVWHLPAPVSRLVHQGSEPLFCMQPLAGGSQLAIGGMHGELAIISRTEGRARRLPGENGAIVSLSISPGGQKLLTSSNTGAVSERNLQRLDEPTREANVARHHPAAGMSAYSAVSGQLASVGADGRVLVRAANAVGPRLVHTSSKALRGLSFDSTGTFLVVIGDDGVLTAIDLRDDSAWSLPRGEPFASIAASPVDGVIAVGRQDGSWAMVDPALRTVFELPALNAYPRTLSFSPSGRYLACGDGRGVIHLFDSMDGSLVSRTTHHDEVRKLAFDRSESRLASASADRTLRVIDLESARSRVLRGHNGKVSALAFVDNDRTLVSVGFDGAVREWALDRLHAFPGRDVNVDRWLQIITNHVVGDSL